MNAVTLYGFPGSTYVRTARMVCEEKRIPYTLSPLEFRSESHRALHPFLRMPAMRAGDVLLFETLAIATYLDGIGEARPLQPAAPPDRARMLQWVSVCTDYGYATLVKGIGDPREEPSRGTGLADTLGAVDVALSRTAYLAGEDLTLADLFLAPMLAYAESNSALNGLSQYRNLSAWKEKLWTRPSFQKTQG